MALRFSRLLQPRQPDIQERAIAESVIVAKAASDRMLFMSHKTGDKHAEEEAAYIVRKHGLKVYMTEWDDNVEGDTDQLPDYIMNAIRSSNAFLVNVSARISVSMWIGYEIGGAHALRKSSAKIMYSYVSNLPSVVRALHSLHDRDALDNWIQRNAR